jgi:hypothetical protein
VKQIALKNMDITSLTRSSLYLVLVDNIVVTYHGATPLLTDATNQNYAVCSDFGEQARIIAEYISSVRQ